MNIQKKQLPKSQVELNIELTSEEFNSYVNKAIKEISKEKEIPGFRKGHAPLNVVKQNVSDNTIAEQAASIAMDKTLFPFLEKEKIQIIARPQVEIKKLALNNPFSYKALLTCLPDVKLGKYQELNFKQKKIKNKESEVDKVIEDLRKMRVKEILVNRKLKQGDKAVIDMEMFLDKVPIEGGQGKNTTIILGDKLFIPGLDEKLLGAKKGETREFTLAFPSNHYNKNLAGKMVEFRVKIKEVYERQLPELNQEFIKGLGFNSLDDLKKQLDKNLIDEKRQKQDQTYEALILRKIIENSEFTELPDMLIESELNKMMEELKYNVTKQQGKFEDYLTSIKKSEEDLRKEFIPQADERVKSALIIRKIGKEQNIKASQEEVQREIDKLKDIYKASQEVLDKINTKEYQNNFFNLITNRKVIEWLKKENISFE